MHVVDDEQHRPKLDDPADQRVHNRQRTRELAIDTQVTAHRPRPRPYARDAV